MNKIKSNNMMPPTMDSLGTAEKVKGNMVNAYAKQAAVPLSKDASNVQISPRAREMSQMRKIAEQTPDIREDKVAYFKDLIAKGNYQPNTEGIANGIMREAVTDELSKTPDIALS